jgi:hypothetical protein
MRLPRIYRIQIPLQIALHRPLASMLPTKACTRDARSRIERCGIARLASFGPTERSRCHPAHAMRYWLVVGIADAVAVRMRWKAGALFGRFSDRIGSGSVRSRLSRSLRGRPLSLLVFVIVIGGHGDAGSSFELLTAELHEHLGGGRYSGALSRSSSLSWPVYRLSSEGNCRVNQ